VQVLRSQWPNSLFSIVLAYSTDGVNPFRSGQYSLWPLVFKVLNLPPSLASNTGLLILGGLIHGPRKPKSMQAYQLLVADELIVGGQGLTTTSPDGKTEATFRTKLILHSCDGPANGAVTNQQVAGAYYGCVSCEICGKRECGRILYGGVRRWLPLDHPYRTDPAFGPPEHRMAPSKRDLTTVRLSGALAQISLQAGRTIKEVTNLTKVGLTIILYMCYYCILYSIIV
jgi:hypothetical protein